MSAVRPWPSALPAYNGGSLTLLKWIALVAMVVDHIDAFGFGRALGTDVGRIVFPVFGFVLAYNVARPGFSAHGRLFQRLVLFGCLALPFHAELVGATWPFHYPQPLNIMFTFAVFVGLVALLESRAWLPAALVFVLAGGLVEYWWPGLAFMLTVWAAYRWPARLQGPLAVLVATLILGLANGSQWALTALPLLWAAQYWQTVLPRLRWAFYAFYPAHLAILWLWV